MSDQPHPVSPFPPSTADRAPPEPEAAEPASAVPPPGDPQQRCRQLALGLAGALALIVVLVVTAPFWAAALPWAAAPAEDAAIRRLEQRVGSLEARPPSPDLGEVRQNLARLSSALADLTARVERLEKAPAPPPPGPDVTARIDALDRGLRAQEAANAAVAAKIDAAARSGQERGTRRAEEVGLVLALLQVRGAVQAGRPFAAEYEALAVLARGAAPDLAAAIAVLAEPAKTGVATPAVLGKRLRELAGTIAGARAPAGAAEADGGWGDAVLARLRGLVTIRRIDSAAPTGGPAAAVQAAETALAGGDLPGAVAALDRLTGPSAEAAAPWLRMARATLAVETALQRIEAALTARLGSPAASSTGSPG